MSIAASFTGRKAIKIHGQVGVFSPPPALHSSSPAPGMRVLAIRARFRGATQMNGSVTISARSPDFQRAFVAMRYFWGMRGQGLADAHDGVGLQPAAVDVLAGLCHAERAERARALGTELARLATALDERGLWR